MCETWDVAFAIYMWEVRIQTCVNLCVNGYTTLPGVVVDMADEETFVQCAEPCSLDIIGYRRRWTKQMWKPQWIGNKQWLLGSSRSATMRLGRKCADNTRWNMLMMLTHVPITLVGRCAQHNEICLLLMILCRPSWIIRASCSIWTREQVAPGTPVSLPAAPRCNFIAPFCTQVHLSVPGTLYYTQDPGTLVKSFLNL